MPDSITLSIPVRDGSNQTVTAVKVTPHFAVHLALDAVVFYDLHAVPWAITHIPTLCRVVFSDSQVHAEQVARMLEALPINWDVTKCMEKTDKRNRGLIVAVCRRLAAEGLAWAEWI